MTHSLAVTCHTAAEHPLQQCSPVLGVRPTETLTLTHVHKQIWTRMSIAALFVVRTKDSLIFSSVGEWINKCNLILTQ